jgi:hypothetical protein
VRESQATVMISFSMGAPELSCAGVSRASIFVRKR